MWNTPDGRRHVAGAEGALLHNALRAAAAELWTEHATGIRSAYGLHAFEVLSVRQRVAVLRRVADALLRPEGEPPALVAHLDAAAALLFRLIRSRVEQEILWGGTFWRGLVCDALVETEERRPPPVESPARQQWELAIEALEDRLLWDADHLISEEEARAMLDNPAAAPGAYFAVCSEAMEEHEVEAELVRLTKLDPEGVGSQDGNATPGRK